MEDEDYFLDLRHYLSNVIDCLKKEPIETIDVILDYLCDFLKEQNMVHLSNININQLVSFLIRICQDETIRDTSATSVFNCLAICTAYKNEIKHIDELIDCFIDALKSPNTSRCISSTQALIVSLSNLQTEIQTYCPQIIYYMSTRIINDPHVSQSVIEFLMYLLFDNTFKDSTNCHIFQILLCIIEQCQYQTAHTLLLAHTILSYYLTQLSTNDRQVYSYLIVRSFHHLSPSREHEVDGSDRLSVGRLQRSGSLSSLNDDMHSADSMRRKMTVLEPPLPASPPPTTTTEEPHPMKKLNDDLIRITKNFINDYLHEITLPQTTFICLPREVRRHHINNSWLADDKILYQIKSYDTKQLQHAIDFLGTLTHDFDDSTINRHRRYTDGNRKTIQTKKDLTPLTTCQDDLHLRPLELDTNRSPFNDRNLWIAVTVHSTTSTKKYLAINLTASPGMPETKNQQLHWFEAVQFKDTGVNRREIPNDCIENEQYGHNQYSFDSKALYHDFQAIISNLDRKDQENMMNRHNDSYLLQTVYRVPAEAKKSIETIDLVDPLRVAKIGVMYISAGQEITEMNILSNIRTSERYKIFMNSIAKLRSIKDLEEENFYRPLLDSNHPDKCGQYAYVWQNSIYQVLFHASTMMPNVRADHEFKKKPIGNDHVIIVYNENDYRFDVKSFKTGVCLYAIEVSPQHKSNYTRVRLQKKTSGTSSRDSVTEQSKLELQIDYLISDDQVANYVRVLALILSQEAELEARQKSSPSLPFIVSPWQNRLQAFRSLHTRCSLSYRSRH